MKHPDPLDQSREFFVDGLIDAAIESELQRHMEQKGKALKERVGVVLGEKEECPACGGIPAHSFSDDHEPPCSICKGTGSL